MMMMMMMTIVQILKLLDILCYICVCLLFSDAETGVYKLTVGKQQEMTLTAVVYNGGEEAHWAMLNILLPPNLHYVGATTQV